MVEEIGKIEGVTYALLVTNDIQENRKIEGDKRHMGYCFFFFSPKFSHVKCLF